jgi:very-short-patch-repair endonuclease
MIRTRKTHGLLTDEHTGVYIAGPVMEVPFGREAAALLAVERSILSHLSAGAVYEIIRLEDGVPIHITVRRPSKSRRGIVVHRSTTLTRADITIHEGLPITSVARTLLDISELLPVREVEWALDEALGRGLVTLKEIEESLQRTQNRGGLTILRTLVEWRTTNGGSRTKWERIAAAAFREAGFPPFEQNVWYLGYHHDFVWREHGVTLEIDGLQWHSLPSRMNRDETKETKLKRHGLDPNRVTNADVEHHILRVVAHMAARLALRDPARRAADRSVLV